uniref:XPG-I domain-containing protein n=1 Tax=Moniliophthora roreri TaxID=221103 RepID=A0A0W0FX08_MONRR
MVEAIIDGDLHGGLSPISRTEEPAFYSTAWELISAFGDCWRMAPGEGEAELVAMSLNGEVDAIITADSDVFPLGAKCVLVNDA